MKLYTQEELNELLDRQACETTSQILKNNPTWDDVRKAIELAQEREYDDWGFKGMKYDSEEIIEELKKFKHKVPNRQNKKIYE